MELSNDELDLVALLSIQAFTHSESVGIKRTKSPQRHFYYQSVPVCKEMVLPFYGLTHGFYGWRNTTRIMVSVHEFVATLNDYLKTCFPRLRSEECTHSCRTTSKKMQPPSQEGYPGLKVMTMKSLHHPKQRLAFCESTEWCARLQICEQLATGNSYSYGNGFTLMWLSQNPWLITASPANKTQANYKELHTSRTEKGRMCKSSLGSSELCPVWKRIL